MHHSESSGSLNTTHLCRICFDDSIEEPLIYPCKCVGTIKFVHNSCLNRWRQQNIDNYRHDRCEICDHTYSIQRQPIIQSLILKRSFLDYFKIIKNIFIVFSTGYLMAIDTNRKLPELFYIYGPKYVTIHKYCQLIQFAILFSLVLLQMLYLFILKSNLNTLKIFLVKTIHNFGILIITYYCFYFIANHIISFIFIKTMFYLHLYYIINTTINVQLSLYIYIMSTVRVCIINNYNG